MVEVLACFSRVYLSPQRSALTGEEVVRYWDALAEIDKTALAQEAHVRHVCLAMNDAFQSISSSQVSSMHGCMPPVH